jgi:hypothetical protein
VNEVPERQDALDAFAHAYLMPEPEPNGAQHQQERHARSIPTPSDEDVLREARRAKNAAKFASLYDDGDIASYDYDDSRADLALIGMLAFYTQDRDQLAQLFASSALMRQKWNRRDYRKRTIDRALSEQRETYDWSMARQSSSSSLPSPQGGSDDDNNAAVDRLEIEWFHELGEPKEREYIIEQIGPKGYPLVAFGPGGVAKSYAMLAAGIAIAGAQPGTDTWLGMRVLRHGHVLYLDFELDVEEQHRRVRDLCAGMGVVVPKKLAYLSGVGVSTDAAFAAARRFVSDHKAVAVIIDSVGLAMMGDMSSAKDVLAFFRRYIDPLRRLGATPFLVDHEGKLQAGEKHKDKTPIGSAYKSWSARSVLQFEFGEYVEEESRLDLRVRQKKANFAPQIKPFGVSFKFEAKQVSIKTRSLTDTEMMDEERVPVRERILAALLVESRTVPELAELTGSPEGTIYNNLAKLVRDKEVAHDGYRGRKKLYRLFSSSSPPPKGDEDDENQD